MDEDYLRRLARWAMRWIAAALVLAMASGAVVGLALYRLQPDHPTRAVLLASLLAVVTLVGLLGTAEPPDARALGDPGAAIDDAG